MNIPENRFKRAIAVGRQQIGLWCSLPSAFAAKIVAPAGFDWLLFDTEHSPSSVPTVLSQLQAVAPYDVSPAVRAATNDTVLIKRLLDIGAQTLFLPYVQSAEEAHRAILSMRYPPEVRADPRDAVRASEPVGRDRFAGASENGFRTVRDAPVSSSPSMWTRRRMPSCARHSTATSCPSPPRSARRNSSTTSLTPTKRP